VNLSLLFLRKELRELRKNKVSESSERYIDNKHVRRSYCLRGRRVVGAVSTQA
jgi:hypothetical protein